jgi:hypothetical protein
MKSTPEQTETAPSAATIETKATKKAVAGARRANVASGKGKAGKKAAPKKKAPQERTKRRSRRQQNGHDPRLAEAARRSHRQRAAQGDLLAAAFPAGVPVGHGRQKDGLGRHVHPGRGRRAELLDQRLKAMSHPQPPGSTSAAFLVSCSAPLRFHVTYLPRYSARVPASVGRRYASCDIHNNHHVRSCRLPWTKSGLRRKDAGQSKAHQDAANTYYVTPEFSSVKYWDRSRFLAPAS